LKLRCNEKPDKKTTSLVTFRYGLQKNENVNILNAKNEKIPNMKNEKTNLLYSLALRCPFELNCEDCPIINIWKIEIYERFDYIDKLNLSEIDEIIAKHYEKYNENFKFQNSFPKISSMNLK